MILFKVFLLLFLIYTPVVNAKPAPHLPVTSIDGYRTVIMGERGRVNRYILDKINLAEKGDTIRLDYYWMEYHNDTSFFYHAIKNALIQGARVEIITEKTNLEKTNLNMFFYGKDYIVGLNNELKVHKNLYGLYITDHGGDSLVSSAINHRKIALLDIGGQRDIIVSTANVEKGQKWEAAIDIDGNFYDSQWRWWNELLDTDICFARGNRNCRMGNGGYESNFEGLTSSYAVDSTISRSTGYYNTIAEWIKLMEPTEGCELRMVMGTWSNTAVLNEMAELARKGCKVDLIYGKGTVDSKDLLVYAKENYRDVAGSASSAKFEIEHQSNVHAKMILWKGNWNGGKKRSYAWIGSLNATTNGLRNNDEVMLRIKAVEGEGELFDALWNYFQQIEKSD